MKLRIVLKALVGCLALAEMLLIGSAFPWSTDTVTADQMKSAKKFYSGAYNAPQVTSIAKTQSQENAPLSEKDQFYVDYARSVAIKNKIPEFISGTVKDLDLEDKHVLEVGAGSGLLQDIVRDYTALDISPTARRWFHKPFVEASATDMPFPDNSFDAVWSVWVLEHIPEPEKALLEIRRVVKNNGYLILVPAWEVDRYAAGGYRVRRLQDLDWTGRFIKASIRLADNPFINRLQMTQVRGLRALMEEVRPGPWKLHFKHLNANYDQYWIADSDATTSLSVHEMCEWFQTRGDTSNCPSQAKLIFEPITNMPLVVKVSK